MMLIMLSARYGDEPAFPWQTRLLGIVALLLLVGVPIIVIAAGRRRNRVEVARFYEGITGIRRTGHAQPGDVHITFHTYSGFLVYAIQRKHELVLPVDQAKVLLARLLHHNLTWGLFAYGVLVIPALSYLEYRAQLRKIAAATKQPTMA